MNRPDCKHPSAYCTMKYESADRAVQELVWNARDMEVPQKIALGRIELDHVDAHRDEFKPFYIPRVGTRIFTDPILDRLEENAEQTYSENHLDQDFTERFGTTKREAIAKIVELQLKKLKEDGRENGPALVTVTPELAEKIQARLAKRGAA